VAKRRRALDGKQRSNLAMSEFGCFFRTQLCCSGIRSPANEGREESVTFRRTAWKERRIPHRAENAQASRARNEKAKARERVAHISRGLWLSRSALGWPAHSRHGVEFVALSR